METNLAKSRESFKRKIPETEKDLEALKHLFQKQVCQNVLDIVFFFS
jgi:hypothetical protein